LKPNLTSAKSEKNIENCTRLMLNYNSASKTETEKLIFYVHINIFENNTSAVYSDIIV